ncbi:Transposon Ty3-I Gag-Pol polyprotein [Labeo rohita]|uniref:Transposon Ty3-I Gag-Pol polyprotein n=1 Tax=Labeo rohita TaxID=84645 RepID=A0ABQ8LYC5_LABRO|nr:Transposon Ty3-I Gag-Pol polyprotein [Labeo rohita]
MWALMLQCSLVGKAQEVRSALPIEESLNYDLVKAAVLRVYELVPEAYRQKFRSYTKSAMQTFVGFACNKKVLLEKWCAASKTTTFDQLQELILLEDFKNCLPESLVVYLNEQKVNSLSAAAVLADEYMLTHKTTFSSAAGLNCGTSVFLNTEKPYSISRSMKPMARFVEQRKEQNKSSDNKRVCFYCLDPGHLIADCKAWKKKNTVLKPKSVGNVVCEPVDLTENQCCSDVSDFTPFVFKGGVSIFPDSTVKSISILRDTGSAQSFILGNELSFSKETYTGTDVLVRGIDLSCVRVPLHTVFLTSDLVSGPVKVGVRSRLPVEGVSLILGNDLAGGKVFPHPIVAETPVCDPKLDSQFPLTFSACAVTRAQARKNEDVIDLSDTFLASTDSPIELTLSVPPETASENADQEPSLTMGRDQLGRAQRLDSSLTHCLEAAEGTVEGDNACGVQYFWDRGVLMRKWLSQKAKEADLSPEYQIVLPFGYRAAVLKLAHDHPLSGHLGSTKTFMRVAKYFYWPGLRSAVAKHCRSCHTCQLAGKPNQIIRPAPLQPIPVMGEPFE